MHRIICSTAVVMMLFCAGAALGQERPQDPPRGQSGQEHGRDNDRQQGREDTPRGMVAFFTADRCPDSWSVAQFASGRLIVGTDKASENAITIGDPMAAATAPSHATSVPGFDRGAVARRGGDRRLLQLLRRSVRHFRRAVARGAIHPLERRASLHPAHGLQKELRNRHEQQTHRNCRRCCNPARRPAGPRAAGCLSGRRRGADGPNHTLARSGGATLSGTTGATTNDVPYVQLLVCRKMQAQAPGMKPPPEVVTFAASKKLCADDWAELTRVNGRYLVGLPQNGASGVSFGGAPFTPGERRKHAHTLSGTWNPNQQGVALASGCCNNGFGTHREYGFTARADDAEAFVPYLELRACQPTGRN